MLHGHVFVMNSSLGREYAANFDPHIWPQNCKTFFMLNTAEHKMYPAHKQLLAFKDLCAE